MNTVKKVYCRLFQTVMKVALPFLPYRDPALLNGIQEVVDVLCKEQKNRVILVTGPTIHRIGLTKPLEEMLQARGYGVKRVCCVDMFPSSANVETVCLLERLDNI